MKQQIWKCIQGGLILVVSLCLLTACSSLGDNNKQVGAQTTNDINRILEKGVAQNKEVENKAKAHIPKNISNALLPGLSIQTTSNKQDTKPRFNIAAKEMPAKDFFMGLVKGTNYNMIVTPGLQGTITLNLRNVTIEEALQAVQDNFGYQYQQMGYGFQIFPRGLETRTFTVNYLDVNRTGQSNTVISSGQITQQKSSSSSGSTSSSSVSSSVAPTSSIKTESTTNFWKQLKDTLSEMIGTADGRKVITNPEAGLVIVRAYPNEFKGVSKYLDSLQANMSREVILEAKILEVKLSSKYQAGIDWGSLGLTQNTTHSISTNLPALAEASSTANSSIFTLNMHYGQIFSTVINLLSTQGNVQTLSSPRIATLNNQMAVIKVGEDEFFVTDVSSTTTGSGDTAQSTQNLDLTPFFSGISLDVTPQIDANGDVILHIHPVVSTVTDETKTFTVSGKSQVLPLAHSKIRESDNVVRAKNKQIVVIGGLMENNTSEHNGSTPFLSKVPIIGRLFKRSDQDYAKTELVILLRPILVGGDTWTKQLKKSAQHFKQVDRAMNPGGHPKIFGAAGKKQW